MALNYDRLMATSLTDIVRIYDETETMLYAQSVGFGRDPIDRKELAYVYEQGHSLRTVPLLQVAVANSGYSRSRLYTSARLRAELRPESLGF